MLRCGTGTNPSPLLQGEGEILARATEDRRSRPSPAQKEPRMDLFDATADPETLTRRADELLDAQRPGAARALLAAAKHMVPQRMVPGAPRMASLAARLEMRE